MRLQLVAGGVIFTSMSGSERRVYRRMQAAVYCRPAGVHILAHKREPIDLSMGGVRIYSDDHAKLGDLLKLEFFLPDMPPVTYTAEVVWVQELGKDSPAKFDLGLKFLQLEPAGLELLTSVLGPPIEALPDEPESSSTLEAALPLSSRR